MFNKFWQKNIALYTSLACKNSYQYFELHIVIKRITLYVSQRQKDLILTI